MVHVSLLKFLLYSLISLVSIFSVSAFVQPYNHTPQSNQNLEMVVAKWQGTVIAESNDCVVVEGNQYFPIESVKKEFLKPNNTTTNCPWKGTANYYDIVVNGNTNPGAAWYYANPKPAAENIKGRVAFWKGVQVS